MNLPAINLVDGYKLDHRRQYPWNTVKIYANLTPRKSRIPGVDSIVFFGLTYFIKEILLGEFQKTFFNMNKEKAVAAYERRVVNYLGPDHGITFEHIEALHDLGYMPVRIKALPEGSLVKCGVPVLTIVNTLPEFYWVPNYLETIISTELWGMSTSATLAFNYRLIFDSYALKTTGSTAFSSTFQGHDFSARGMYGFRAAAMSAAGHLTCFKGSDTVFAVDFLEEFYNADSDDELIAGSVAATEHSVMCMGMQGGELETFRRLITEIYPKGIVSIVSDTWDLWNVVNPEGGILSILKDEIMARDGKVVIRPDSGDPEYILCGYDVYDDLTEIRDIIRRDNKLVHEEDGVYTRYIFNQKDYDTKLKEIGEDAMLDYWDNDWFDFVEYEEVCYAEAMGVISCLQEIFGSTQTAQGYTVLDPHIGTIYGDSITLVRAKAICEHLMRDGFASTNWVAGVGSYTYQYQTRDSFGFAMKATYGELVHDRGPDYPGGPVYEGNIEKREIFKDPITDDGTKKSARGLLEVVRDENGFKLHDRVSFEDEEDGWLLPVFENGTLITDPHISDIRTWVDKQIKDILDKEMAADASVTA